ncbi:hypothetical protein DFH09DRAFT_929023, partial [Mycena vulgaris]
ITRTYPWRLFAPLSFGGAFITIVFLIVINMAPQGYETVPAFNSDFNVTQTHWFDRFLPSVALTRPGTLCDPRLLALGKTITTNNSLFQYTIASIDAANAGDSGFSYEGWILDNCDITSVFVTGNAMAFSIDFTGFISYQADAAQIAQGNRYEITARADWSESTLPGQSGQLLGVQKATKNARMGADNKSLDVSGAVLEAVTAVSSDDFTTRVFWLDYLTNGSFPTIISFAADFPWCPASLGHDAPCAQQVPPLNVTGISTYEPVTPALSLLQQYDSRANHVVDSDTVGIISNLVQVMYSAVRFDLGNPSPNNFLLNTSVISDAIVRSFPQNSTLMPNESFLYSVLVNDGYYSGLYGSYYDIPGLLPLTLPGPAVLDGVYLCRFQRAKSVGSAFIAVLVATLSMFMAAWARYLSFAESMAKTRYPGGSHLCLFAVLVLIPTYPFSKPLCGARVRCGGDSESAELPPRVGRKASIYTIVRQESVKEDIFLCRPTVLASVF